MRGSHRLHQLGKVLRASVDSLESNCGWLSIPRLSFPPLADTADDMLPRVALVKQDVYADLYCCPSGLPARDVVLSSHKRTGPVALLTRLNADFRIVKTEPDPECSVWREKVSDCHQAPIEYYESLKTKPFMEGERGHQHAQGEFAVAAEEVDWGAYDIVISLDVSVPARLTRRYPQTVWCYYISEPCMGSYRRSLKQPIEGYDLFLNQRYRRWRVLPGLAAHEVEFPYFLQHYGCYDELFGCSSEASPRTGIFVESHTAQVLAPDELRRLEAFGPVGITTGTTESIVRGLMRSRYFLRLGGRQLWGNAMVEAIAAGCLALGNPREYRHRSLYTPATVVSTFDDVIQRIGDFERDPSLYQREVSRQRRHLDYLCFTRPVAELFEKATAIRQKARLKRA